MTDRIDRLRALDALLRHRHVGRAAAAIGISQPSMSRVLARLRRELADPLLVAVGRGYVLTQRAEIIAMELPDQVAALESILAPAVFDATRVEGVIRLGAQDYEALVFLPKLSHRLARLAPGLRLDIIGGQSAHLRHLVAGALDCAIQSPTGVPESLFRTALFRERLATLHPANIGRLDLEAFLSRPHIVISTPDEDRLAIDLALEAIGRKRTVAMRLPYFSAAPQIAAAGGYLFSAPGRLLATVGTPQSMRVSPVPLPPLQRPVPVSLYWHARRHHDPLNRWFRRLLLDVARHEMGPLPY